MIGGMASSHHNWFNSAVIYQIYPRSFYDADGNGVGDLAGILEKLDYLCGTPHSLGVNAIWICPFYTSPMADGGYDVSDYRTVDPLFGNLDDFKRLLKAAHQRDLKIFVDFVPNHTSDQHEWFLDSKQGRTSKHRDWYVWRDPKSDGSPPNNWLSIFGGSAWEYDEASGQYYLHSFLKEQPDLNWDNPEVRDAMHTEMRFWLDMGVDGFRVDAVNWLSIDPKLDDEPTNPDYNAVTDDPYKALLHTKSVKGPKLYEYLHGMTEVVKGYTGRFMVTEAYPTQWDDTAGYMHYYRDVNPRVSAPFNFEAIFSPWDAASFRHFIDRYQHALHAEYVPIYSLGNHDSPRVATRIGAKAARTAAMMQLTLPGTPTIYYGDELGMPDAVIEREETKDLFEKNVPDKGLGRDPERTPLAWDSSKTGGFGSDKPWLPLARDYKVHSVEKQQSDPISMLNLYRQLLRLRNTSDALRYGSYRSITLHPNVFAYIRETTDERLAIILNFSADRIVTSGARVMGTVKLSTCMDKPAAFSADSLHLRPHEGLIIALRT